MAIKITDHADRAVADLLEQFKGKPNIEALLRAIGRQVQDLEEAFWQLLTERFLDNAVGAQLDLIGRIVRRERGSLVDDVYRAVLRGKIAANLSSGTHPEVLRVVELCIDSEGTGAHAEVVREPPAAATIRVVLDPLVEGLGPHVADLVTKAASSGVRVLLQYGEQAPFFRFDGAGDNLLDNPGFESGDQGWGKGTGWEMAQNAGVAHEGEWLAFRPSIFGVINSPLVGPDGVGIPTEPGESWMASAWLALAGEGEASARVLVQWRDAQGQSTGAAVSGEIELGEEYEFARVEGSAPAGTAYAQLAVVALAGQTADFILVDNAALHRIEARFDGGYYLTTTIEGE